MLHHGRTLGILTASVLLLAGCGGLRDGPEAGAGSTPPAQGAHAEPLFRVIASEKTLPRDFYEAAPDNVLVRVAADADTLEELWSAFGFKARMPEPAWDRDVVLFLGTGESGSCPLEVKDAAFDQAAGRLVVRVEQRMEGTEVCTMDFTPRAFALALPRSLLAAGWREVQLKGAFGDPVVPVEARQGS